MQPGEAAALLREDGDGALRDMVVGYGSDNQGVHKPRTVEHRECPGPAYGYLDLRRPHSVMATE
eukprot:COSAG02_NODE_69032_length_205_cov_208.792453_1_plen_64_part_10